MTDKQTLSLNESEWRGLLMQNLVQAHEFAQGAHRIGPIEVKGLHERLDRMKALVAAWHLSQPALPPGMSNPGTQQETNAPVPQANGAEPKKKPGWPKGKPRKRANPDQVVQ
jgi:hypothetical protein